MTSKSYYHLFSVYNLLVGSAMIIVWAALLLNDQVPELRTQPISITYHLFSEAGCAVLLVASSRLLWTGHPLRMHLSYAAWGALLYSVCVNTPYYWNLQDWTMVGVFSVIQVLTLVMVYLASTTVLSTGEGMP